MQICLRTFASVMSGDAKGLRRKSLWIEVAGLKGIHPTAPGAYPIRRISRNVAQHKSAAAITRAAASSPSKVQKRSPGW